MTGRAIARQIAVTLTAISGPVTIRNAVQHALLLDGLGQEEAVTRAYSVERIVIRELELMMSGGPAVHLVFNSSSTYVVQGRYYVEPMDDENTALAKRRRQNIDQVVSVYPSLSPEDFEELSTRIIGLIGARDAHMTRYRGDQGIDFYGRLILSDLGAESFPFLTLEEDIQLWILGQAKHYPNRRVPTADLRELVGSIQLVRARAFSTTTELYRDLAIRLADPVLGLFLTTGEFTRDARQLAANSGIVAKDGRDIAEFLLDKSVGVTIALDEVTFSKDHFFAWLHGSVATA